MYAAKRGYNSIITLLLKHDLKINVHRQNKSGMCLLMIALYFKRCHNDVITKMINKFEHNMNLTDTRNRTILIHCINTDNTAINNLFLKKGAFNLRQHIVNTCKDDDVKTIREYFRKGLVMSARLDSHGTTISCMAAQLGAYKIINFYR
eukprot:UN29319